MSRSNTEKSAVSTSAARRQAVHRVAQVFRHYGYDAATMSIFSAETQLGRSSLYHHFPGGKEDMALAALDYVEQLLAEKILATLRSEEPYQRQVADFIAALDNYYEGGKLGCLLCALGVHSGPAAVAKRVAQITNDWIASLTEYLDNNHCPQAAASAQKIVRLIQGGLVMSLATQAREPFQATLADVSALLSPKTASEIDCH